MSWFTSGVSAFSNMLYRVSGRAEDAENERKKAEMLEKITQLQAKVCIIFACDVVIGVAGMGFYLSGDKVKGGEIMTGSVALAYFSCNIYNVLENSKDLLQNHRKYEKSRGLFSLLAPSEFDLEKIKIQLSKNTVFFEPFVDWVISQAKFNAIIPPSG